MDAALNYLSSSARTVREVERRLDELEFGEIEIMDVVERLKELNLVDDAAYCRDFTESRLRSKPVSRRHLMEQLNSHEAEQEAIEAAVSAISDEAEDQNAVLVAEKYARQFSDLADIEQRMRLEKRLLARGFDYETTRRAVEAVCMEERE